MITVPVTWFDFFPHQHFEVKMDWPWPHPAWQFLPLSHSLSLYHTQTHTQTHSLSEVDHYSNVSAVCLALLS